MNHASGTEGLQVIASSATKLSETPQRLKCTAAQGAHIRSRARRPAARREVNVKTFKTEREEPHEIRNDFFSVGNKCEKHDIIHNCREAFQENVF